MLGRSPLVFTPKALRRLSMLFQLPLAALCACGVSPQVLLWAWPSYSWLLMNPLLQDPVPWERLPFHLHSWQSSRTAMPNVFGSITSSPISCAHGPLRTMMSLSPRFRWSSFATMTTTWTGILAEMATLTVIGSGWILRLGFTNCGRSAETTRQLGIRARDEAPLRLVCAHTHTHPCSHGKSACPE